MKALVAFLVMTLVAGAAGAGPIVVTVTASGDEGDTVPVKGARVAVVRADAVVDAEQQITTSSLVTDEDGRVEIERPGPEVVVLAGIAFRGITFAWAGPLDEEVELDLPAEIVMKGRVLDPDGEPVVAAEVLVAPERALDTGEFLAPGTVLFKAWSDGDGRFEVPRLARGRRFRLRASGRGLAPAVLRDLSVADGEIEVRLAAGVIVRGLVISAPGGEPVEGATVRIGEVETKSNGEGRFELTGVVPGRWPIEVEAAGRVHIEDDEIVLADGDLRRGLVISVLARGRLRGRVLTPSTEPAAGATIYLRYPAGTDVERELPPGLVVRAGEADEDGRFDLVDLLPAEGVDLIAVHADHAPMVHFGYSIVAGRTFSTVVLMRDGGTLEGIVLDGTDRSPIGGAQVLVLDESEDLGSILSGEREAPPTAGTGVAGDDGVFRIENLPPGRMTVVVRAEGRVAGVTPGVDIAPRTVRSGLVFYLGAGAAVEGRVVDADGVPIEAARATLVPDFGPSMTETADADGVFRFRGIPAGPYNLRAAADGYLPGSIDDIEAPASDVVVTLGRGTGLLGRVRIEDSSEPARGAVVRALVREEPTLLAPDRHVYRLVASVRADPETAGFRFDGLPAGEYRLTAHTPDGLYGVVDGVRLSDVAPPALDVRVRAGLGIHGRVLAVGSGDAIEGAVVRVDTGADEAGPLRATSGQDGHFVITGVPTGFHTLFVSARDFAPVTVESVEVRDAVDSFIGEVVLRRGTVVRGTVTSSDGIPRSGARVLLSSADFGGTLRARTDEFGEFTIERVAAGAWLVTVEDPVASMRRERLIKVEEGVEVNLRFGSGVGASLAGQVTISGDPVPHARLSVLSIGERVEEERDRYSVVADEFGNYLLADVPSGEYQAVVSIPGRRTPPVRVPLTILPGPLSIRDFEIPESGFVAEVEALDTGDPVAGATVFVELDAGPAPAGFLEELASDVGEVRTDESGRARIDGLAPGLYRVSAEKDGYARTEVGQVRVFTGDPAAVRIALPAAGAISGVVLDDQRRVLSGARVEILDESGRPATRELFIEADSAGRFRVRTLAAGRYTVRARASGRSRNEAIGVDVVPGRSTDVELLLAREGRIVFTVYGAGGIPLEGARVSVRDFWGRNVPFPRREVSPLAPYHDPELTGEDGSILVAHLPPGIYEFRATSPGLEGPPARVQVLEGELARGALVLLPVDKDR